MYDYVGEKTDWSPNKLLLCQSALGGGCACEKEKMAETSKTESSTLYGKPPFPRDRGPSPSCGTTLGDRDWAGGQSVVPSPAVSQ